MAKLWFRQNDEHNNRLLQRRIDHVINMLVRVDCCPILLVFGLLLEICRVSCGWVVDVELAVAREVVCVESVSFLAFFQVELFEVVGTKSLGRIQ
jgi:hypothetical protein